MPVSRKPKVSVESDKNLEEFIQGGGSEPTGTAREEVARGEVKTVQPIKLRIPGDLLAEIDGLVAHRKPSPSRHQWILEALYEKVAREKD